MKNRRLLLALLLLWGCGSSRNGGVSHSDSVRVEIIERRVVVRDTARIVIPQIRERVASMCDSSLLQNQYSLSEAIIRSDGTLFHSLSTIPQELQAPVATEVELRDSIIFRERVVTQYIEVAHKLSAWQQFQIYGFYLLLTLVLVLLLLWRITSR